MGASVLFVPALAAASTEKSMAEENFIVSWCFRDGVGWTTLKRNVV